MGLTHRHNIGNDIGKSILAAYRFFMFTLFQVFVVEVKHAGARRRSVAGQQYPQYGEHISIASRKPLHKRASGKQTHIFICKHLWECLECTLEKTDEQDMYQET